MWHRVKGVQNRLVCQPQCMAAEIRLVMTPGLSRCRVCNRRPACTCEFPLYPVGGVCSSCEGEVVGGRRSRRLTEGKAWLNRNRGRTFGG